MAHLSDCGILCQSLPQPGSLVFSWELSIFCRGLKRQSCGPKSGGKVARYLRTRGKAKWAKKRGHLSHLEYETWVGMLA